MKRALILLLCMFLLSAAGAAPPPEDGRMRCLKALKARDYKAADAAINAWLQQKPKDAEGHALKSMAQFGLKNYHAALEAAERAVALDKKSARAHEAYGAALLAVVGDLVLRSQWDEAGRLVESAARVASGDPGTVAVKAILLYERGRLHDDSQDLAAAADLFSQAKGSPGLCGRVAEGATMYLGSSVSSAFGVFDRSGKSWPDVDYLKMWSGRCALSLYRGDEAQEVFKQLLGRVPNSAVVLTMVAEGLAADGRHAEAGRAFQQAASIYPANVRALLGLARAQEQSSTPEEAIVAYERAFKAGARGYEVAWQLGVLQRRMGRLDAAIQTLHEARQRALSDPQKVAQATVEVALARMLKGEALDYAEVASRLTALGDSDKPKLSLLQGYAALTRRDLDGARRGFKAATGYEGEDAPDVLVLAYIGMGEARLMAMDGSRKLGRERIQAINYYSKAWQNVLKGTPIQATIQQRFEATKASEIKALQDALETNVPLITIMGGGQESSERLKEQLLARLAQARALQLGAPGTLRSDNPVVHATQ